MRSGIPALFSLFLALSPGCSEEEGGPEAARKALAEGEALLQAGKREAGLERLREGCRLAPDHVPVHRAYQNEMRRSGDVDELLKEYETRVKTAPYDPVAIYLHGRLLDEKGMEKAFRDALNRDPEFSWAHSGLGHLLFDRRMDDEAFSHLQKAWDALEEPVALSRMARIQMRREKWDEAAALWKRFQERFPDRSEGYAGMGQMLNANREYEKALVVLRLALERNVNDFTARALLIGSLLSLKREKEAATELAGLRKRVEWGSEDPKKEGWLGELTFGFSLTEDAFAYGAVASPYWSEYFRIHLSGGIRKAGLRETEGGYELLLSSLGSEGLEMPLRDRAGFFGELPALEELLAVLRKALEKE